MEFLSRLSLKAKLIGAFVLVAVIPVVIVTYVGVTNDSNTIMNDKISSLNEIVHIKKMQLEERIQEQFEDLELISDSKNAKDFIQAIDQYHVKKNNDINEINRNDPDFQKMVASEDEFFSNTVSTWGYHDMFIICAMHGHVIYSVSKGEELGMIATKGNLAKTGLEKVWNKVVASGRNTFVDFSYYEFSGEAAAFLGVPLRDKQNKIIAVMALQIEHEEVTNIVQLKETDFATQEVFVVGEDKLMRSDSKFSTESTVMVKKLDNKAIENVMKGEEGNVIDFDYRGMEVISVYEPVKFKDSQTFDADFNWFMFAEIDKQEVTDEIDSLIYTITLISFIVIFLVSIGAYFLAGNISRPIVRLSKVAEKIGRGDLTEKIERSNRQDEVSILINSFAEMIEKLKSQISKLIDGTNVLVSSSSQISSTISELTASSNQTVSAVNETSTTVDEVKQTAQVAKDRANEVTKSSEQAMNDSVDGESAVNEMSNKIINIKNQMGVISESITELSEQGSSIGEIMNSINDLAEQSNLLAVNAAIEAAKAGEKGKGFAVVANEVRSLAEQSKRATQQVRTILNDIQKAASKSVMATEEGGKAVEQGVAQVGIALEKIQVLAKTIEDSSQSALQIAASSQQQFAGIDQINTAVKSINEASGQNLNSAQQLNIAAQNLKKLGEDLKLVIDFYKIG